MQTSGVPVTEPGDGAGPSGGQLAGDQPSSERRWVRRMAGYCWRHPRAGLISLCGTLLGTFAALAIPLLQRDVVDNGIVTRRESIGPRVIGLLVAAAGSFGRGVQRRCGGGAR